MYTNYIICSEANSRASAPLNHRLKLPKLIENISPSSWKVCKRKTAWRLCCLSLNKMDYANC